MANLHKNIITPDGFYLCRTCTEVNDKGWTNEADLPGGAAHWRFLDRPEGRIAVCNDCDEKMQRAKSQVDAV